MIEQVRLTADIPSLGDTASVWECLEWVLLFHDGKPFIGNSSPAGAHTALYRARPGIKTMRYIFDYKY